MYPSAYINLESFLMQPISSSSQAQDKVPAANITNPVDNQQLSTALTRTVSAAQGDASASTSTEKQAAAGADTPDSGLIARTVRETQALSVRGEPLHQTGITTIISAGRLSPVTAGMSTDEPLTDNLQLPEGHTYQPYFWISQLAHRLMAPPIVGLTDYKPDAQSLVIDQLLMSERAAKQDFQSRFEYRLVDSECTSVKASGEPEKNYGVFASKPVEKGALLGVYSGIGYLLKSEGWAELNRNWHTAYLHQMFTEEMPDFMSYYRTMMAGLRGKEETQRTITNFTTKAAALNPLNFVSIVPDNERYTPMHLVNSAKKPEDVNTVCELVTINTGSDNFYIPALIAKKKIAAGQELLSSFNVNPDENTQRIMTMNAAQEREYYDNVRDMYLDSIYMLNRAEPDRPPISPFVAAPAIYLSEVLRKTVRNRVAITHKPSSIGAARD